MNFAEKFAVVIIGTVAVVIIGTVAVLPIAYCYNIYSVVAKPQYQTLNVPNVVCGIGIFVPPVGSICGVARVF